MRVARMHSPVVVCQERPPRKILPLQGSTAADPSEIPIREGSVQKGHVLDVFSSEHEAGERTGCMTEPGEVDPPHGAVHLDDLQAHRRN